MTFKDAYKLMAAGKSIKRPTFKGYWYLDKEDGKLVIHLASGKDIRYGNLTITMKNCLADDWAEYIKPKTDEAKTPKAEVKADVAKEVPAKTKPVEKADASVTPTKTK